VEGRQFGKREETTRGTCQPTRGGEWGKKKKGGRGARGILGWVGKKVGLSMREQTEPDRQKSKKNSTCREKNGCFGVVEWGGGGAVRGAVPE